MEEVNVSGERIHLKKSKIFGWSVIHPNKIDGKINWKNLLIGGSWSKLFIMILIVILILVITNQYAQAVTTANQCLLNSTKALNLSNLSNNAMNFSNLNFSSIIS